MRKLFFNIGFQFNYGEPFRPSNFYNATYYQNIFNGRDFKGEHPSQQIDGENDVATEDAKTQTITESSGIDDSAQSRNIHKSNDLIGTDLTAAQLYESIEDNFAECVSTH